MVNSKYEMIMEHIKEQLTNGVLRLGSKLPSIRSLSLQFNCSKNTIIHAYHNLEKEKVIYAVPKSGYYVLHQNLSNERTETKLIDFASNSPDPSAIPHDDFIQCLNQAIALYQDRIFSYDELNGFFSLRKVIEKHLMTYQVFTKVDQIFIASGARQVFHFLNILPFPNGKTTVLVEQPSFSKMLNSLKLSGVTVIGITRTKEGIDLDELESHFRNNNIKFFYTVPRSHPSLATSYTMQQKKQIALLAQKYDVYIVEDDYIPDLDINKKADPIFSIDTSDHTLYIKSFSKILSPGLRLAIVVLPINLIDSFKLYKNVIDKGPAALSQGSLEIFLTNGMFERHVARVRKEYQLRLTHLRKVCEEVLPEELETTIPESGIYSIISFPVDFPLSKLLNALSQHNVIVATIDTSFLQTYRKNNSIRISILRTDQQQITQGIRIIGGMTRELLPNTKESIYLQS